MDVCPLFVCSVPLHDGPNPLPRSPKIMSKKEFVISEVNSES
jgi:hypothetical protein